MKKLQVIRVGAVAMGLLFAPAGSAGAATSPEAVGATQPYPLENAKRFVVQGRRVGASAASRERAACRMPRTSLSLAPHERAIVLRELSLDQRTCRATYERGVPPGETELPVPGKRQQPGAVQVGDANASAGASASASTYRYSGYAKAWYWDRRNDRVINSVRSGASWNGGACIGANNTWFRNFADTATGWFQVSKRWSNVNDVCAYLISSTNASFRDRRFTGCSDGPVVDAFYSRVRFVGYPDGGQKASKSSRVEPSCSTRLTAWFALYRGQPPSGP
jgi:hypothetical protein